MADIDALEKFFVLGLARSGIAVSALLARDGRRVVVWDDDAAVVAHFMEGDVARRYQDRIAAATGDAGAGAAACDCVVVSPGVPSDHPVVARATAARVPVVGEIEIAWHFTRARIVGVTGTNGGDRDPDTLVLELSSFQLDTIDDFHADVAVLLNVTPDHLDRYAHDFNRYAASKARILNHADPATWYVYNAEDPVARDLAGKHRGGRVPFSSQRALDEGVFFEDGVIVRAWRGERERVIKRGEFTPVGVHNLENALASIAAAIPFEVSLDAVRRALRAYRPLPHRMELVRVVDGVAYVNDSKATNVDATVKSLMSVDGPVIVILGGRDKEGDFSVLVPRLGGVKRAVLIGEARAVIRRALAGHCELADADDMTAAVRSARAAAVAGDTVLLAPACASFDMFKNYQDRGEVFRACVNAL
jgi:UDP-N-acetylmuramoylalanine--D-glutamate ligase